MKKAIKPFLKPIYVTQPLLPDLDVFRDKLQSVWDAKWLTNNGRQHQLFEKEINKVLKVPHTSLFNNGTIALITACQSLRLSGEVITTPFTFAATPHVLTWNTIAPIFCDVEPHYMTIDPEKIERLITPHTTAILGVHVFGHPCNVAAIQKIADRHGLKVIYDAAHAFGVELENQLPNEPGKKEKVGIGNFGDITMFSFHATKLFHTAEGGALTFKDPNLKSRIDLLKNFGIKNEEEVIMPGINGKMNEIQAALGLVVLEMVAQERENRAKILATYHKLLENVPGVEIVTLPSSVTNSYQYFVIRIKESEFGKSRDQVYNEYKNYNVFTRKYFYPLCSEYVCYRNLPSADPRALPIAHQVANEVLSMPFYGSLALDDVEKICELLKAMR